MLSLTLQLEMFVFPFALNSQNALVLNHSYYCFMQLHSLLTFNLVILGLEILPLNYVYTHFCQLIRIIVYYKS